MPEHRWRTVRIKMRGTTGQRRTVTRTVRVYSTSPAEAVQKAQDRVLDEVSFEVVGGARS